ncbi:MAG: oligosaccharide flippase family protein [Anaerolineales bacterium]
MNDKPSRWETLLARLPINEFSIDVFWNVLSLLVLALGGFLVNALVVYFEGEATLGVFNQVFAVYTIASQIGVGGIQFSILKTISHNQDNKEECTNQAISGLLLVFLITLPISFGSWLLAEPIGKMLESPDTAIGIRLISFGLMFFTLNKVLINVINGLSLMKVFAIFRALRYGFIPIFVVLLFVTGRGGAYLTLSLSLTELVLFFIQIVYVFGWVLPWQWPKNLGFYLREHLSFGIKGMFSGVLTSLNNKVDVLMLGYFTSDARVGIYAFAAMLADGASQLPSTIRWNLDPILGRKFSEGKIPEITSISKRVRRVFVPVMIVISILVVVLYPLLIRIIAPGTDIKLSWTVFSIIMVGVLINSSYRPMKGIFLQTGRPIIHTLVVVGLIVSDALLNLIAIPKFEILGAAVVTSFTYILEAILVYAVARWVLSIKI